MTDNEIIQGREWHRKFAVDLFNQVWELLDKNSRTSEEDDRMLHAAHASRFHWGEIGTNVEIERGEWQVSRVYAVLNHPQSAIFHARRCLEICETHQIGDFDIAFAHEAIARAYGVAKEFKQCRLQLQLAKKEGNKIKELDDREYFFSELKSIDSMLA